MFFLLFVFLQHGTYRVESGYATAYWPGDGHCGKVRADGKPFRATDDHIAHRSLRLGTSGLICNVRTNRCVRTTVRDRGPFGALRPCDRPPSKAKSYRRIRWKRRCWFWDVQIKLRKGWRRRGTFDVTRPVMRALRMRPFDYLVFVYKAKGKPKRQRRAKKYAYSDLRR